MLLLILILFVLIVILFGRLSVLNNRVRYLESHTPLPKQPVTEQKAPSLTKKIKSSLESPRKPKTLNAPFFNKINRFLTLTNSFVAIGMLLLFFGVAFLLNYAIAAGLLPLSIRLLGIFILAVVLFFTGIYLEKKRFNYAVVLEGGALAILYLLIFAGFYLYDLVSAIFAFVFFILLSAFTLYWSFRRNHKALAVMGIIGGFFAPVLFSAQSLPDIYLFLYYFILNLAVFTLAWFKNWRALNVLGFIFTFLISTLWYATSYFYVIFLWVFFVEYLIIALLTARHQPDYKQGLVEASLVFALPAVVFLLQAFYVDFHKIPLAYTAVALGTAYLLLSAFMYYYFNHVYRILAGAFLGLALIFFTLAVPLIHSGSWVENIWALEAIALIWVSLKQHRPWLRYGGLALLIFADGIFYLSNGFEVYFIQALLLDILILFLSHILIAYQLWRGKSQIKVLEYALAKIIFAFGGLLWFWLLYQLTKYYLPINYENKVLITMLSLSALLALLIEKWSNWHWLKGFTLSLPLFIILFAVNNYTTDNVFFYGDYMNGFWLLPFLVTYSVLSCYGREPDKPLIVFCHFSTFILLMFLLADYINRMLLLPEHFSVTWRACCFALVPGIFLILLQFNHRLLQKHFGTYVIYYQKSLTYLLLGYLFLWLIVANLFCSGDPSPLAYRVILNPLDFVSLTAFIITAIGLFYPETGVFHCFKGYKKTWITIFALTGFVILNAIIIRAIHFMLNVPCEFDAMLQSQMLQVTLSLTWSITALALMISAQARKNRALWYGGAALAFLTILKLFSLDLSHSQTLERIIAFIGVGAVLLLVGYFAPIPPLLKQLDK